jgi:hypothetical protein
MTSIRFRHVFASRSVPMYRCAPSLSSTGPDAARDSPADTAPSPAAWSLHRRPVCRLSRVGRVRVPNIVRRSTYYAPARDTREPETPRNGDTRACTCRDHRRRRGRHRCGSVRRTLGTSGGPMPDGWSSIKSAAAALPTSATTYKTKRGETRRRDLVTPRSVNDTDWH